MRIRWKINKNELDILFSLMGDSEPRSVRDVLKGTQLSDLKEKWTKEGFLVSVGENYRMEEGLQLAIATMMDPKSNFSCSRTVNGSVVETKKLYLHGETIILLEDDGNEAVNLLWLPFLPLAIGAVSEMFRTGEARGSENQSQVIYHVEGFIGDKQDLSWTIRQKGETFETLEERENRCTKTGIVGELTDWLSACHKECLKGVLGFE